MTPVFEGDFCSLGLAAVTDAVAAGRRPLQLLARPIAGRCTAVGEHTPSCLQHFHHHTFTVPCDHAAAAASAAAAHAGWAEGLAAYIRSGGIAVAAAVPALPPVAAAALRAACCYEVPATAFAAVMPLLPRSVVASAALTTATIDDAHAAAAVAAYQRWLNGTGRLRRWPWAKHVRQVAAVAMQTARPPLPPEIADAVLAYLD
ncbi:hypothetical protein [Nereida ignava]|uniref:hypothetical protein n=1 Tax=Nereida ignava TaxID=282199 RepID=UPI0030F83399